MTATEYLAQFWPEATEVRALCESLEASLSAAREEGGGGGGGRHAEYLTDEDIAEGLLKVVCVCV